MAIISEGFRPFSLQGITLCFGLFLISVVVSSIYNVIYNLFFHPLRHIPGPLLSRASGVPRALHIRNGTVVHWLKEIHDKYGEVVRITPGEVSFISAEEAWSDIYGFRIGRNKDTGVNYKDQQSLPKPVNGVYSLILAKEDDHSRMRRNVSHAFSENALRQQEPLIQDYIDLLIHRLGECAQAGEIVDIMRWYNYATFDIITDLSFGEPLYCLRDNQYHNWVNLVFSSIKVNARLTVWNSYPFFKVYDIAKAIITRNMPNVAEIRREFGEKTRDKVGARLEKGEDARPDFFSFFIKNQKKNSKSLTREEMDSNAILFLIAGSETTATALSGSTYFLLQDPERYAKLAHEVRSHFKSSSEITIEEVNKLDYLIACLKEGIRHYPPVPAGFPRVVPSGGNTISGHYIPQGTKVSVTQHATYHSERNFKDPESYVPERWLGDERYKNDSRDAYSPFSFGPRNCIGKNLAYAEMRVILAKILFNFDLELVDKTENWMEDQKVFALWEKPALNVKLTPIQH